MHRFDLDSTSLWIGVSEEDSKYILSHIEDDGDEEFNTV